MISSAAAVPRMHHIVHYLLEKTDGAYSFLESQEVHLLLGKCATPFAMQMVGGSELVISSQTDSLLVTTTSGGDGA